MHFQTTIEDLTSKQIAFFEGLAQETIIPEKTLLEFALDLGELEGISLDDFEELRFHILTNLGSPYSALV